MSQQARKGRAVPERYVLVGVCFLAAAACYLDRVGFPLAYTAMAQARKEEWASSGGGGGCGESNQTGNLTVVCCSPTQEAGVSKEAQGRVHSAFYYGYTLSQVRWSQAYAWPESHSPS